MMNMKPVVLIYALSFGIALSLQAAVAIAATTNNIEFKFINKSDQPVDLKVISSDGIANNSNEIATLVKKGSAIKKGSAPIIQTIPGSSPESFTMLVVKHASGEPWLATFNVNSVKNIQFVNNCSSDNNYYINISPKNSNTIVFQNRSKEQTKNNISNNCQQMEPAYSHSLTHKY